MSVRALRKLNPGESLPAFPRETFNTIIDLNTLLTRKRHNRGGKRPPVLPSSTIVYVRNDTGVAVDRYWVLGIDEPLIDPADDEWEFLARVAFSGVTPTIEASSEDDHEGRFVITLEPIAEGKIGRAAIAGAVHVAVDVIDETHQWAECKNGVLDGLESATWGSCRILWKQSGTGWKYAIVRMSERLPDKDCTT